MLCESFENELKVAFRFCEGLQVPCHIEANAEVSQKEKRYFATAQYDKYQGKIIWAEMTKEPCFIYEDKGFYINQTCYFIPRDDMYLCAVLNSKLIYFYMKQIASSLGDGAFRWIKQFVEKLPVIESNAKNHAQIAKIKEKTAKLIELKKAEKESLELENELDSLIYGLYGLNENEKAIIESTFTQETLNGGGVIRFYLNAFYSAFAFSDKQVPYQGKILYPCIMAKEPCFVYEDKGFFAPAPANLITGKEREMKYLTGLLNSNFIYFAMRNFYMGGGIEGELKTNNLLKIPIPKITAKNQKIIDSIISLVDEILSIKNACHTEEAQSATEVSHTNNKDISGKSPQYDKRDISPFSKAQYDKDTSDLEKQIDTFVYRLYDLTQAEIGIIESQ